MSNLRRAMVAALDSRRAFRLVQLMAAAALLLSVWVGWQQYRMTKCQARYNEASATSTRARAAAAEADRQALDSLMLAVAEQPRGAIQAVREYNAVRRVTDQQRAANPLPPPPSQTCG